MKYWTGGTIHIYISIHDVVKPDSVKTLLRLVTNSALKVCNTVPSINDNLFMVLVSFRCYVVALVWDLSKAYNSIKITLSYF